MSETGPEKPLKKKKEVLSTTAENILWRIYQEATVFLQTQMRKSSHGTTLLAERLMLSAFWLTAPSYREVSTCLRIMRASHFQLFFY